MPGRPPAAWIDRATSCAQVEMSSLVKPTTVGFPVVPDDACTRATCACGTAKKPNG